MHVVLHDWPDARATEILENIKAAMEPGYSKILIHESVIPTRAPHPTSTALDLTMMAVVSALERTEEMWRALVEGAGLKLVKIWRQPATFESVIEVVLP